MNMLATIVPKSDQINADDLIGKTLTITITDVSIKPGTEQPVTVHYEGGRPFRPCKSMCRVMVAAWGPDANAYVGRSMTLYRDPKVKWGGLEVGGIRISHMSDLPKGALTMALTETKGSRKPFVVKPLPKEAEPASSAKASLGNRLDHVLDAISKANTLATLAKIDVKAAGLKADLEAAGQIERRDRLSEALSRARADLEEMESRAPASDEPPSDFPGDTP